MKHPKIAFHVSKYYKTCQHQDFYAAARDGCQSCCTNMIYSVLPLIAKMAGKYQYQDLIDYEDMLQAGLIAVNRAIRLYDPKVAKWTTYATTYAANAFRTVYKHAKCRKNVCQKTITDIIDDNEVLQLYDHKAESPVKAIEKEDFQQHASHLLEAALRKLHTREELLIRMRYGLTPYETSHTLIEIAEKHRLSKERVRQITDRALYRLNRLLRDEESLQDG